MNIKRFIPQNVQYFSLRQSKGVCNFHHFFSHCVCQDDRVNYCYTKFENGRCQAPKPQNISKKACCCTGIPGQGWGDPCEICPSKGEGAYTSYHRNTHTCKETLTYVCVLFNGIHDFSHLMFPEAYLGLCSNIGYQQEPDDHSKGMWVTNTESSLSCYNGGK